MAASDCYGKSSCSSFCYLRRLYWLAFSVFRVNAPRPHKCISSPDRSEIKTSQRPIFYHTILKLQKRSVEVAKSFTGKRAQTSISLRALLPFPLSSSDCWLLVWFTSPSPFFSHPIGFNKVNSVFCLRSLALSIKLTSPRTSIIIITAMFSCSCHLFSHIPIQARLVLYSGISQSQFTFFWDVRVTIMVLCYGSERFTCFVTDVL